MRGFNMSIFSWSALLIHMQEISIKYCTFPFILHWSIIKHNFWGWKQGGKKSYFQVALLLKKEHQLYIKPMCFSLILILLTVYSFAKYTAHQRYTNSGPLLRASNQKKKKSNRKEFYRLEKSYHFRVPPMLVRKAMHNVFKWMLPLVHERFVCMLHMNRKRYKSQGKQLSPVIF